MGYLVKELFLTLQGEGANAGRAAVFCRFAGCNLWSGREEHRSSAVCRFCDTDFVGTDGAGGGRFASAAELADAVVALWLDRSVPLFLVCTGGEPLLQVDQELVDELKARGVVIAIETNGTLVPPTGIDWVCVSPKAEAEWVLRSGQELKVVFPQPGADPGVFVGWDFEHRFLQPMDGQDLATNTAKAIDYCLSDPRWSLSVQTHKYLGIP